MNEFLNQAYLATNFNVLVEHEIFTLKINKPNTYFDNWCQVNNVKSWAFITAYNPYSEELNLEENIALNSNLETEIVLKGYNYSNAVGVPDDENWESEASFFIHNISLDQAIVLGNNYKQNAIVFGLNTKLPELVWLV